MLQSSDPIRFLLSVTTQKLFFFKSRDTISFTLVIGCFGNCLIWEPIAVMTGLWRDTPILSFLLLVVTANRRPNRSILSWWTLAVTPLRSNVRPLHLLCYNTTTGLFKFSTLLQLCAPLCQLTNVGLSVLHVATVPKGPLKGKLFNMLSVWTLSRPTHVVTVLTLGPCRESFHTCLRVCMAVASFLVCNWTRLTYVCTYTLV